MEKIILDLKKLELVLNDMDGLLAILHKEEEAGLEQTSLRIEINALESIANKMYQLGH